MLVDLIAWIIFGEEINIHFEKIPVSKAAV
jgi:hypothetical protein